MCIVNGVGFLVCSWFVLVDYVELGLVVVGFWFWFCECCEWVFVGFCFDSIGFGG